MSFSQLIATLKARKLAFFAIIGVCVLLALTISLVLPKKFTATASVVIDVKSPDPIAGMVLPGLAAPSYMATQLEVVRSERVAKRVISSLNLDRSDQLQSQWRDATEGRGDFTSWLADLLSRSLDVIPSREANVITVSYTATDPTFAAVLVNAFVKAYIETTSDLRSEPARQYSAMFDSQSKVLRDRLEAAQATLSAYQREKGMIATDERLDIETNRLNELSTQLVAVQALTAESMSRKAQSGANTAESLANPVVAALKADLSRQEARLKELSSSYGASHPLVLQQQASIGELRARIDAEIGRVTSSVAINNTVNLSREAQIKSALEQQRQKVLTLKSQRDEASVLLRDVENAQRAYDTVQLRFSQTSLESQSTQTNVSPLKMATPPPLASFPKPGLNLIAGAFLGFVIAIGACVMLEASDRRLRDAQDVIDRLELPVMAMIPRIALATHSSKAVAGFTALKGKAGTLKLPHLPK